MHDAQNRGNSFIRKIQYKGQKHTLCAHIVHTELWYRKEHNVAIKNSQSN